MLVANGLLSGRLVTMGYGPEVTAPLSEIDTSYKGLASRTVDSLTRSRTSKVLVKRTVSEK